MGKKFEIVDGIYRGPSRYPDDLYLCGTGVTSLGSLERVDGCLYLQGTSVTDLGCLKKVGGWLYLEETPLTSLGSLVMVGGNVYTGGGRFYSLAKLKRMVNKIEDSSVITLVESFHVIEDLFLKRVIERRIRGG